MKTQKVWSIISILVILGLAIYLLMGQYDSFSIVAWPIQWWKQNVNNVVIGERPSIKAPDGTTANDGGIYLGKNNNYAFTQTESESLNPDTQAFNKNIPTLLKSFSTFDLK